jgi:hypothetical protein
MPTLLIDIATGIGFATVAALFLAAVYLMARATVYKPDDGVDEDLFDENETYGANGFNAYGLNRDGRDSFGFDSDGVDRYGRDVDGRDATGYDKWGFDRIGRDRDGRDAEGYDVDGLDVRLQLRPLDAAVQPLPPVPPVAPKDPSSSYNKALDAVFAEEQAVDALDQISMASYELKLLTQSKYANSTSVWEATVRIERQVGVLVDYFEQLDAFDGEPADIAAVRDEARGFAKLEPEYQGLIGQTPPEQDPLQRRVWPDASPEER